MPLPALQLLERKFEKQRRLFELKKGVLEREIERHIQIFEQKKGALEKKIEQKFDAHKQKNEKKFEAKKGIRLDDEVRFIRSWIEKPLAIGAVTASGKALARTMATYVDPNVEG